MHLRLVADNEGLLFRQLLNHMLNHSDRDQQEDRLKIIRALEIISNLAHAGNDNGIYLIDYIHIMVQNFLHIPDILVLVHTLECLYQLSELGEQLCDAILNVQSSTSVIATLIDLLTIEARSFSSQTIKTIKIVEMSTGPVLLPSYHQPPVAPQSVVIITANQPAPQAQPYLRPLTVTGVNPATNPLSVATFSSPMLSNSNEKNRKHDCKLFFSSIIKESLFLFSNLRNHRCCGEWHIIACQTSSSNSIEKTFASFIHINRRR